MNAGNDAVTVQIGGAQITVQKSDAVRAFLNQVLNGAPAPIARASDVPRIGQPWPGQGGIYAGIVRGDEGQPDYHLIVGPQHEDKLKWDAAVKWASSVDADGYTDFALPKRREQAVMFGNVPELFEKTWYWSGEQSAPNSSYAWYQDFDGGTQNCSGKGNLIRVRAVRRLIIE